MAVKAGKDGKIIVDENQIGYIDNFSLTINAGTAETSQIGNPWKEYIQASRDWSGSLSGTLDYADTAQKAIIDDLLSNTDTTYALELVASDGITFSGNAIFTSINITGSHGDKIAISVNYQGTGPIAPKGDAA